jgi:selenocysteine lyase/cysteine desulfurase
VWDEFRSHFPIFESKTYLNTCSLAALSRQSKESVEHFLRLWQEMGASAWYALWMGEIERLRTSVARLLDCGTHEIALMPNVSTALSAVASSLDYSERNRVVCSELDFPTVPYQWQARARDGVEVQLAGSTDGMGIPESAYAELLDERTAVLATSHVLFTTGWVQDLEALAKLAHDAGALFVVDAYQSAGILPLPVRELGIDILLAGGLKWLMGGAGIAYLYVREGLLEQLDPRATGWFAVEDQFSFSTEARNLRPDARRLEGGTPSPAAVYAARAGIDLVLDHGIDVLGGRTLDLVDFLISEAERRELEVRAPAHGRRSGIVILPNSDPQKMVAELAGRQIIVDARPTGVRVSPYAYNTEEDVERLLDVLQDGLTAGD